MDPITQGLLGAAIGQGVFGRKLGRGAALVGALGGTIGDLDVLQRFFLDPVANIAYHRHWTHSLLFLPIGAAIVMLPFLFYKPWKNRWKLIYAAACLSYLSHLLIDACTSYGTVLFWPISSYRVAFDSMPIIDPIFTSVLLVAVIWAAVQKRMEPARVGLALATLYVALGFVQHERAMDAQRQLAESRGDQIVTGRVMPTLGNILVWRSIYRTQWLTHTDAVRVSLIGETQVVDGLILPTANESRLPMSLDASPRLARDYELWAWFTGGFLAAVETPDGRWALADTRYSMSTEAFSPLWAMSVDPDNPENPTDVIGLRQGRSLERLWDDIWSGERFSPLSAAAEQTSRHPPAVLASPIKLGDLAADGRPADHPAPAPPAEPPSESDEAS